MSWYDSGDDGDSDEVEINSGKHQAEVRVLALRSKFRSTDPHLSSSHHCIALGSQSN